MRLAFRVAYLGTRFFGSQMQAAHRTVEGEFIAACRRLDLFSDFREAGFLSAGRTDRGVHARGQVIAFSTDSPDRAVSALNIQLPPDCWCTGYTEVPPKFHPRYDARSRTYRYYFAGIPDDPAAMKDAVQQFCGTHNFTNLARVQDKNPNRTILTATIGDDCGFTYLEVTADSFLWHQVRCMATSLWNVGTGAAGSESIAALLAQESEQRVHPAPAEGLILWDTDCGLTFAPLEADRRSLSYLGHLLRHHALMGRICGALSNPGGNYPHAELTDRDKDAAGT